MDIGSILITGTSVSFAIEKAVEVAKIGYLKLKKILFPKNEFTELTKNEKMILTVITAIAGMLVCGQYAKFEIPGISDMPYVLKNVIYGLMLSVGSGIWHTLWTMFKTMQSNFENPTLPPTV